MDSKLSDLQNCIERGKASQDAAFPPDMKGQPGATELVQTLLDEGMNPAKILNEALIPGMREVGRRFQANEAFVPDMLVSADAMKKSMNLLREELLKAKVEPKGTFIVGTVKGDLHDIGKNLVAMMIEGAGYHVVDLGVDTGADKFLAALDEYPNAIVGMSALLTTTMGSMKGILETIRATHPECRAIVGGAPLTESFAQDINANGYAADPQGAVELLERLQVA